MTVATITCEITQKIHTNTYYTQFCLQLLHPNVSIRQAFNSKLTSVWQFGLAAVAQHLTSHSGQLSLVITPWVSAMIIAIGHSNSLRL